jgi:hypothetical protein
MMIKSKSTLYIPADHVPSSTAQTESVTKIERGINVMITVSYWMDPLGAVDNLKEVERRN